MKKLILTALTAMLTSGTAYAQNNDHHGGPGNPPNAHGPANPSPNNHGPANPHPAQAAPRPGPAMMAQPHPVAAARPGPAMMAQPHAMPAARNMGGRRPGNGNGFGNGPGNGPGAGHGRHHLPPGISIPAARHSAPMWRGRAWGIGDTFILSGFHGPYIRDWGGYDLPPPRPGTHWIYVDGYYLMIGNRSGRIFAEVSADY